MESGVQKGELSYTHHSTWCPNRKRCAFHLQQNLTLLCHHHSEEERYSPRLAIAQPVRDCLNSASEGTLCLQLPVSRSGLFVYTSPSQPLLLWVSPSFVLKGLHAVHHSGKSPVTILCCSCINPFRWWNNWLFYCFRLTLPLRILFIWYLSRSNGGLIITNF